MPLPRWVPITQGIATAGPFALFGGLGPGEHLAAWLAAAAGWATWMIVVRYGIGRGWWLRPEELESEEAGEEALTSVMLSELSPRFTRDDVQREFRRQAKLYHPDVGGEAAAFRELVEAKEQALKELGP